MDLRLKDKVLPVTGGAGTAFVNGFFGEGDKAAFSSASRKKIGELLATLGTAVGRVAGSAAS